MPRFRLTVDQYDILFFGGGGLVVVGVALFSWPLLLVAAGAGLAYLGYRGEARGGDGRGPAGEPPEPR